MSPYTRVFFLICLQPKQIEDLRGTLCFLVKMFLKSRTAGSSFQIYKARLPFLGSYDYPYGNNNKRKTVM